MLCTLPVPPIGVSGRTNPQPFIDGRYITRLLSVGSCLVGSNVCGCYCLFVGWLVGWLDGWLVGWLVGRLVVGRLVGWLVGLVGEVKEKRVQPILKEVHPHQTVSRIISLIDTSPFRTKPYHYCTAANQTTFTSTRLTHHLHHHHHHHQ